MGVQALDRIVIGTPAPAPVFPLFPVLPPSQLASIVSAVMAALAAQAPAPPRGEPSQRTLVLGRPDETLAALIRQGEEDFRGENLFSSNSAARIAAPPVINLTRKRARDNDDPVVQVIPAPAPQGPYVAPPPNPASAIIPAPMFVPPVANPYVPPPLAVPVTQIAAGVIDVQAGAVPVRKRAGWEGRFKF